MLLILLALAGLHPPEPLPAQAKPIAAKTAAAALPSSIEVLLLQALDALGSHDSTTLSRLTTGREDFLKVYPFFAPDTSSDRRDFALGYFMADNRKLLRRAFDQNGGHRLSLVRFTVAGPVEKYGGSELHRGLRIWISRDSSEVELKFLRSVLHTGSSWKIWSYADD